MEIAEYVYEDILEPSYRIFTKSDANHDVHRRKMRREATMSNKCSEMSESARNHRKSYVDHSKDTSRPTRLIHRPGNSSDEYKVLGDIGSKYSKIRHTKDRGQDLVK